MTQSTDLTLGASLSGTNYRTEHNSINQAFGSMHKGSARPSYAVAGMIWIDESANPTWTVYMYDGTNDISLGSFNVTTNVFTPANAALKDGSSNYAADSVGTDTYAITNTAIPTPTAGMTIRVKFGTANTGACTLNVNGGGNVNIQKLSGTGYVALNDNDILANSFHDLCYTGTVWAVISPLNDAYYVSNQTSATIDSANDYVLFMDASDSNKNKRGLLPSASGIDAVTARSSNTIWGTSDKGTLFVCTSTFTQTITAAATLGSAWFCWIRNDGTGVITIDPNSSETIDGLTTIKVYPGESFVVVCDGSDFKTVGRKKGWVLMNTVTASASASMDFTTSFDDTEMVLINCQAFQVRPATSGQIIWGRVKVSGAFNSGAGNYQIGGLLINSSSGTGSFAPVPAAQLAMSRATSNSAGEEFYTDILIWNTYDTTGRKKIDMDVRYFSTAISAFERAIQGGNYIGDTTAIQGFQILMGSGNLTSGTGRQWGFRM